MKKFITLFLTTISIIVLTSLSYSQTTVSYSVEHGTDAPSTVNGCSNVELVVVYNNGGANVTVSGGVYQLDQNLGVNLFVSIPSGATVVSKKINFSFTLSSNVYTYDIIDASNWDVINYAQCSCPPVKSKTIIIQEYFSRSNKKVIYHIDNALNNNC